MSDRSYRFVVENSQSGNRLDRVLPDLVAAVGQEVSRSLLQNWIRDGHVLVAGKTVKPRHPLSAGEEIILTIPEVKERELKSEAIPLEILYEDDDLLVIHKLIKPRDAVLFISFHEQHMKPDLSPTQKKNHSILSSPHTWQSQNQNQTAPHVHVQFKPSI